MPTVRIIGNSGAARECFWILQDIYKSDPAFARSHPFGGFYAWQGFPSNLAELETWDRGKIDDYPIVPDDRFVIGIGKPELRRDVFVTLKKRGANFLNLVHPLADICPSAAIGEANIFQRYSCVYANSRAGNGNYFNGSANISHDAHIGDFNFFGPYAIVLGNASIGDCNHLGPHSVVLDHANIGSMNLLAPGSCVYKGCGNGNRLLGNPALKVGPR